MATKARPATTQRRASLTRVTKEDLSKNPFQPATLAAMALAVTLPEWKDIGTDVAPGVELETLQQRITSLLALRCVAVLAPAGTYKDHAVSTIGKSILKNSGSKKTLSSKWPEALNETVLLQLSEFVGRMLKGYKVSVYREYCFLLLFREAAN